MNNRQAFSTVEQQQAFNQKSFLENEAQKKVEEIKATMQGIYALLAGNLIDEQSAVLEHINLINSLKTFENNMINEARMHRTGDWRDPVKTVKQLENTIHKVFDAQSDMASRKKAVDDFQMHARNSKFTMQTKAKLLQLGALLGMTVTLPLLLVAPPLGVGIACLAVSTLGLMAVLAFMAHTFYTRKNQDDNRGLDVSHSLNALNKNHTPTYGTFFNRPKKTEPANVFAVNLTPAFKAG